MSLFGGEETVSPLAEEGFSTDIAPQDEIAEEIPAHRAMFHITNAISERNEDGLFYEVDFTPLNLPEINFPIPQRFWRTHSNPIAQQIGRGQFRALVIAALGKPRGRLADLQGKYVSAWVKDGGDWGPQLSYFKAPTKEQLAAVRDDTDSTETTN